MTTEAQQVLNFFADLAGSSSHRRGYRVDTATARWLPLSYTNLFRGESGRRGEPGPMQRGFDDDEQTQRIFKKARLHEDEGILRVGWMWVAGKHPVIGPVFHPLASMSVRQPSMHGVSNLLNRVVRAGYEFEDVVPTSELELTDLVTDPDERDRLSVIPHGDSMFATMASSFVNPRTRRRDPSSQQRAADLRKWAVAAAAAADLPAVAIGGAEHEPGHYMRSDGLTIVLGVGLYLDEPEGTATRITTAATLRSWAGTDVRDSAFQHLYADGSQAQGASSPAANASLAGPPSAVRASSSMLLNPAQASVVESTERNRLTVVSGPPGTGKSQTVVATALRHVGEGRSVLVAAPTDAAVSALVALFESTPGPDPIVFGASMKRLDVANRLADGAGPWFDDAAVERSARSAGQAVSELDTRRREIVELLRAEDRSDVDPAAVLRARQQAPGLFDADVDLHVVRDLLARAGAAGGWWSRWRSKRAVRGLHEVARCDRGLSVGEIGALHDIADARQQAATLESSGGLDLGRSWDRLQDADNVARRRAGEALQAATHHDDRADRSSRRAVGAVAAALRAGRARRRQALAKVSGSELTQALPLWVATLRDIDDLLPMDAGLFDVVIIDEASHVDQIGAAPALLRARSAMIVGDPRQLRHVSFLAEDKIAAALAANGLADSAAATQLDVRRQTIFDAAASVAPVVVLDEHYRSAPHLIAFSAARFYDGRLHVATRHPRNDADDRIDVISVKGTRTKQGVNSAEVEVIVERLRAELAAGSTSVGVLSPFRAQAEAIEAAVLESFDLGEIEALDLRVGTVHSFQGCQRDVVYASLVIDDDSPRGSRSFLSEATLFNVMVTRAKEQMHVVTSASPPERGVLADYLRHANSAPRPVAEATPGRRWRDAVSDELVAAGLALTVGYRSGRHEVDIVVGGGDDAVALVCGVHPDGPDAHIDRHLDLLRAGWQITEVFESRWGDRLPELAIELRQGHTPDR